MAEKDQDSIEQLQGSMNRAFKFKEKAKAALDTGYTRSAMDEVPESAEDAKALLERKRVKAEEGKKRYMEENHVDENGNPIK